LKPSIISAETNSRPDKTPIRYVLDSGCRLQALMKIVIRRMKIMVTNIAGFLMGKYPVLITVNYSF
jgi:hypothetical protein